MSDQDLKLQSHYENRFAEAMTSKDVVKYFSKALAKAESDFQVRPKRVLVNGIIRDDVYRATYHVDEDKLSGLLDLFLKDPNINPDILINGIVVDNIREISFTIDRQQG